MKKAFWLVFGMALGFVLAHFVNKDPRGRDALAEFDARITEFTDRIAQAYHQEEVRLTSSDAQHLSATSPEGH